MNKIILSLILIYSSLSFAVQLDSTITAKDTVIQKSENPQSQGSKWYYGGSVSFGFSSNYFSIGVQPIVAYKITPKLSLGGKISYTYWSNSSVDPTFNSSNYGGSLLSRYRIIPQLYAQAEFAYMSFENAYTVPNRSNYLTERVWVPFLLLGGGFSQMVSPNVWAYAEVLFDVLNDTNSPYEEWDPFISIGVGVGF